MALHKSQLKFTGPEAKGGIVGFVSRNARTGQLKGVREHSGYKKKICVLSEGLKGKIIPNALYDVELKEMHKGNGYVVTSATLVRFTPEIEVVIDKGRVYQVKVSFGNKVIYFDPLNGKSASSRTVEGVRKVLASRVDIQDMDNVLAGFTESANTVLESMAKDGLGLTG